MVRWLRSGLRLETVEGKGNGKGRTNWIIMQDAGREGEKEEGRIKEERRGIGE